VAERLSQIKIGAVGKRANLVSFGSFVDPESGFGRVSGWEGVRE
jgi:hypothetical protein